MNGFIIQRWDGLYLHETDADNKTLAVYYVPDIEELFELNKQKRFRFSRRQSEQPDQLFPSYRKYYKVGLNKAELFRGKLDSPSELVYSLAISKLKELMEFILECKAGRNVFVTFDDTNYIRCTEDKLYQLIAGETVKKLPNNALKDLRAYYNNNATDGLGISFTVTGTIVTFKYETKMVCSASDDRLEDLKIYIMSGGKIYEQKKC